jgi:hypothetical protein
VALRNAFPVQFSPSTVSDAIDATNIRDGVMAALTNLIPDPSTTNLWQCRPASMKAGDMNAGDGAFSPGFSSGFQIGGLFGGTQTFISALLVVGNRAYGMVATTSIPGHDAPFSFNLSTNSFDTISGITAPNTPASPPTSGFWTPPSIAAVGTKLIFTHPGFNFTGGFAFGVLDISNPAAPAWTAQNTTVNALAALPSWVAQFNGRAWFLVNIPGGQPAAYFTDVLAPTVITNANQIVTFEDNQALTVAAGLGLFNQLGGQVQALMVFKGTANVYQITGDAALSTLSRNSLNVATGTASPLSVTTTPAGLAFLAPDGLRLIDFYARISDPIGVDGKGINVPFLNIVEPTRANMACNQNVLRASVQNGGVTGAPQQEWWFDISRKKWSGPHTFPASMIEPYLNTFIMAPLGILGSLWRSDVVQSLTSSFVENGVPLSFAYTTCFLPDAKQMAEFCVVETTLNMALTQNQGAVTVQALDQQASVLGQVQVQQTGTATIWGQFNWGQASWGAPASNLAHRDLNWPQPLVFSRMQFQVTGTCTAGFKIGDMFTRMQRLGYLQRYAGAG